MARQQADDPVCNMFAEILTLHSLNSLSNIIDNNSLQKQEKYTPIYSCSLNENENKNTHFYLQKPPSSVSYSDLLCNQQKLNPSNSVFGLVKCIVAAFPQITDISFFILSARICIIAILILSEGLVGGIATANAAVSYASPLVKPDTILYHSSYQEPDVWSYSHQRSSRQFVNSEPVVTSGNQSNSVNTSSSSRQESRLDPDSCEVSNIKCALRHGCGMALQVKMLINMIYFK